MSETTNIRRERIEKLLYELEYEVTRGILEQEIDETLGFTFFVPRSRAIPEGVVRCEFRTQPIHYGAVSFGETKRPRLKIVKS